MILHILNKSPDHASTLQQCLNAIKPADSLILIEDGVYALSYQAVVDRLPAKVHLYVLQDDCVARSISINSSRVSAVDYPRFVELVTQHQKTLSWL